MQNFFLGDYIKQKRLDLGLTQEQLCDGICEPMTLSRLETASRPPAATGSTPFCSGWACRMTAILPC